MKLLLLTQADRIKSLPHQNESMVRSTRYVMINEEPWVATGPAQHLLIRLTRISNYHDTSPELEQSENENEINSVV